MQLRTLSSSLGLLLALVGAGFCVFDEEPLVDFTDLNVLHVGLFCLSLAAVVAELTTRARAGHFVHKDTLSLLAAAAFWVHLDNYVRALLLVLSFHALTPLEIDLLELVEIYHSCASWLVCEIVPPFLLISLAHTLTLGLNLALAQGRRRLQLGLLLCILGCLAGAQLLLVWDTLLAGLSSIIDTTEVAAFYAQPKTNLTYDQARGVTDQFEWHRERVCPFVFRFEDLYFFLFRLLLVYSLGLVLAAWLLLLADFARAAPRGLSFTQLAVGVLWLEHAWVAAVLPFLLTGAAGVRLLARTAAELGGCLG